MKELIRGWTRLKWKLHSAKDKVKKRHDKPQTGRKYSQKTHLIELTKIYKEFLTLNEKTNNFKNMSRTLVDTSPERIYRWHRSAWEDQHRMSLRKCKLKWDTATHLLEWPKCGNLTVPNAGEDVEQQERSFTAGGKTGYSSYFGRQSGSFL